jgi:glycine/D-amino acid oxidase-like deaminating enzyme/nitrite reductase/ring-hydroxylating ferredoxin subunit
MDATEPLWTNAPRKGEYPTYTGQGDHFDVAVIGGGITGITCAFLLKRAGLRVAVFEAGTIGSGVSGRTSAHLTQVLDIRFHQLAKKVGDAACADIARSCREAIDFIEHTAIDQEIDCDFKRVPGFLYAQTSKEAEVLERERTACLRAGIAAQWGRSIPLPFDLAGVLEFPNQARFHPRAFVYGLAAQIPDERCSVFEHSRIEAVHDGAPCRLTLEGGAHATAGRVVMATHTPLNAVLLQTRLSHYQSYVVSGPSPLQLEGLYWDLEDPYHYIRAVKVNGENHLIVGGEDHKTGQEKDTQAAFDRIAAYARRLGVTVEHAWSAQVVEPVDGLPLIGRNAGTSRVFVATGYSGTGLTFGTVAAQIIAGELTGVPHAAAEHFHATRFTPLTSIGTYLSENVDYPLHLVGDALAPAEAGSVDEVGPGEGRLVRVAGKRLAVYRDFDGSVRAVSSVCTHLACHVHFNNAERTWDCPCHGSRFDVEGRVLEGPALKPLARAELSDEHKHEEAEPDVPLGMKPLGGH